jgi:very-short-patch-repair endonuclease
MDFLMLLPDGVRVVLEVDGTHHYADNGGRASPFQYAKMASADRELKLAGYEVYRFGGAELDIDSGASSVIRFFESLFKRFRVLYPR